MLGRDDAFERRLDHLPRRGRDHEEREPVAVDAALEELDQRRNVAAQPDPPAGLLEVLAADAAELGIVADQVGQLPALLHQVARAPGRRPSPGNPDAPISSLSTSPESLKLRVWSKSDATRKCLRKQPVVIVPPLACT